MAKHSLPSETDILKAIYAAVRHEDQTRTLLKNPKEKALNAFYTPIKVFLDLPATCEVEARFGVFGPKKNKGHFFSKIAFVEILTLMVP